MGWVSGQDGATCDCCIPDYVPDPDVGGCGFSNPGIDLWSAEINSFHDGSDFTLVHQIFEEGWSAFGPSLPLPKIVPWDTLDARPTSGDTDDDPNGCKTVYTWAPDWLRTCAGTTGRDTIRVTVSWVFLGSDTFRYTVDVASKVTRYWCWRPNPFHADSKSQFYDGSGCVVGYTDVASKEIIYNQQYQTDVVGDQSTAITINFAAPAALTAGSSCDVDCINFNLVPVSPETDDACLLRHGFAVNQLVLTPTMVSI